MGRVLADRVGQLGQDRGAQRFGRACVVIAFIVQSPQRAGARSAFMWLINPLVEESWLATGAAPASSGRIALRQLLAELDPPLIERS